MPTPESRFARALAEYLESHTQLELSRSTGVDRTVISNIGTGNREPARKAAKQIIRGIPEINERRRLLREWLEDNIPENCTDLLRIIDADPADPTPLTAAAAPTTERQRAIQWLHHQLDTNLHAVHAIIDLYRAAGSPEPTVTITKPSPPAPDGDPTTSPFTKVINYADHLGPEPTARIAEDPPTP